MLCNYAVATSLTTKLIEGPATKSSLVPNSFVLPFKAFPSFYESIDRTPMPAP
jgi:hypothetical protein